MVEKDTYGGFNQPLFPHLHRYGEQTGRDAYIAEFHVFEP
jgi:hypothetical protein